MNKNDFFTHFFATEFWPEQSKEKSEEEDENWASGIGDGGSDSNRRREYECNIPGVGIKEASKKAAEQW